MVEFENVRPQPIFFAPMEGITDPLYREVVMKLYPSWNYFATYFLRIPSTGVIKPTHVIKHFGKKIWNSKQLRKKTIFQILVSARSNLEENLKVIEEVGPPWLDLNFGCPSKTVNSHEGGSYLLSDIDLFRNILTRVRKGFSGYLSAKIRVGYRDDTQYKQILKTIEDCGIDLVIIHGRTRDQMYKGRANWEYMPVAVNELSIPVVVNGDIWNHGEVLAIMEMSKAFGVMLARPALKTPWLPEFKTKLSFSQTKLELENYFLALFEKFEENKFESDHILKRFKSLSRYIFDDFEVLTEKELGIKRPFLRSKSPVEFLKLLNELPTYKTGSPQFDPALHH